MCPQDGSIRSKNLNRQNVQITQSKGTEQPIGRRLSQSLVFGDGQQQLAVNEFMKPQNSQGQSVYNKASYWKQQCCDRHYSIEINMAESEQYQQRTRGTKMIAQDSQAHQRQCSPKIAQMAPSTFRNNRMRNYSNASRGRLHLKDQLSKGQDKMQSYIGQNDIQLEIEDNIAQIKPSQKDWKGKETVENIKYSFSQPRGPTLDKMVSFTQPLTMYQHRQQPYYHQSRHKSTGIRLGNQKSNRISHSLNECLPTSSTILRQQPVNIDESQQFINRANLKQVGLANKAYHQRLVTQQLQSQARIINPVQNTLKKMRIGANLVENTDQGISNESHVSGQSQIYQSGSNYQSNVTDATGNHNSDMQNSNADHGNQDTVIAHPTIIIPPPAPPYITFTLYSYSYRLLRIQFSRLLAYTQICCLLMLATAAVSATMLAESKISQNFNIILPIGTAFLCSVGISAYTFYYYQPHQFPTKGIYFSLINATVMFGALSVVLLLEIKFTTVVVGAWYILQLIIFCKVLQKSRNIFSLAVILSQLPLTTAKWDNLISSSWIEATFGLSLICIGLTSGFFSIGIFACLNRFCFFQRFPPYRSNGLGFYSVLMLWGALTLLGPLTWAIFNDRMKAPIIVALNLQLVCAVYTWRFSREIIAYWSTSLEAINERIYAGGLKLVRKPLEMIGLQWVYRVSDNWVSLDPAKIVLKRNSGYVLDEQYCQSIDTHQITAIQQEDEKASCQMGLEGTFSQARNGDPLSQFHNEYEVSRKSRENYQKEDQLSKGGIQNGGIEKDEETKEYNPYRLSSSPQYPQIVQHTLIKAQFPLSQMLTPSELQSLAFKSCPLSACTICLQSTASIALFPCGHLAMCVSCARRMYVDSGREEEGRMTRVGLATGGTGQNTRSYHNRDYNSYSHDNHQIPRNPTDPNSSQTIPTLNESTLNIKHGQILCVLCKQKIQRLLEVERVVKKSRQNKKNDGKLSKRAYQMNEGNKGTQSIKNTESIQTNHRNNQIEGHSNAKNNIRLKTKGHNSVNGVTNRRNRPKQSNDAIIMQSITAQSQTNHHKSTTINIRTDNKQQIDNQILTYPIYNMEGVIIIEGEYYYDINYQKAKMNGSDHTNGNNSNGLASNEESYVQAAVAFFRKVGGMLPMIWMGSGVDEQGNGMNMTHNNQIYGNNNSTAHHNQQSNQSQQPYNLRQSNYPLHSDNSQTLSTLHNKIINKSNHRLQTIVPSTSLIKASDSPASRSLAGVTIQSTKDGQRTIEPLEILRITACYDLIGREASG